MARRFNIGDRVVRFNPSCYSTIFHKDDYIEYAQVKDADDDRFTTCGKLSSFSSTNHNECYQSSGKLVYGYTERTTFWFNLDTEQELIEEFHKKMEEQFLEEVRVKNAEEIARIEAQIKLLEKVKARLQDMTDAYVGYDTLKTFEHIGDMNNVFKNKIEMCNKFYKR